MSNTASLNTDEADSDFVSLSHLYRNGHTIGVLADAIEHGGIYCWDRFGRFKLFKPESAEAERVLDVLAAFYANETDPMREVADWEDDTRDNLLDQSGWPRAELPEVRALPAQPAKPAIPPRNPGGRPSSDKVLIAVLWGVIRGHLRCAAHPQFKSNAELIGHIVGVGGYDGLEASTLERKFAAAAKFLCVTGSDHPQNPA